MRLLNVVTDGGVQTASFEGSLTRPAVLTAHTTKYAGLVQSMPCGWYDVTLPTSICGP